MQCMHAFMFFHVCSQVMNCSLFYLGSWISPIWLYSIFVSLVCNIFMNKETVGQIFFFCYFCCSLTSLYFSLSECWWKFSLKFELWIIFFKVYPCLRLSLAHRIHLQYCNLPCRPCWWLERTVCFQAWARLQLSSGYHKFHPLLGPDLLVLSADKKVINILVN